MPAGESKAERVAALKAMLMKRGRAAPSKQPEGKGEAAEQVARVLAARSLKRARTAKGSS